MSKEKQKFFRLSAFNCDRSQGPNPLSPRAAADQQSQQGSSSAAASNSKKPRPDPNSIRLGVKVSKLSDTSEDDDDDDGTNGGGSSKGAGGALAGLAMSKSKQQNGGGAAEERLSDSSSSCSSSNDSSSSSDSCSDDDSSDDSDDSSSLSSNSSLSSSYEPDAGGKPPGSSGGNARGGAGGSSSKDGGRFSPKKGSLDVDANLSSKKNSTNNGTTHSSRSTFSFTDFSAKTADADGGVWGFAAEAKKSAEIFATPTTGTERIFGEFGHAENKTPGSSRGRKAVQREVMKETRNTFNRDFADNNSSAVKRRVARAQSDSNNNMNSAKKKETTTKTETPAASGRRKGTEALTVKTNTPKTTTGASSRAALTDRSAANDNFVSPSGSGSRATTSPYIINGQNSTGKDAIPQMLV